MAKIGHFRTFSKISKFAKKFQFSQNLETQPTVFLGDLGGLIFQRFAQICFCGSKINFQIFDKKVAIQAILPKSQLFEFPKNTEN